MSRRVSKGRSPAPVAPRRSPAAEAGLVAALLALFLITQYPHALRGPFVADDYLFLEKARLTSLPALVLRRDLAFHYYRPISRELHYGLLSRAFGPRPFPFHLANLLLALSVGCLYFLLVRSIAGSRIAGVATAAVAALSAWGVLMLWAAGCQDLWMLAFSLATLLAFASGRRRLALLSFAAALLSKETGALVPAIALVYALTIEGSKPREALRNTAGLWVLLVIWAALHPMLGGRLLHPIHEPASGVEHLSAVTILTRTGLSLVNLDELPRPDRGWAAVLPIAALAMGLLGALIAACRAMPGGSAERPAPGPRTTAARVAGFGAGWAVIGWSPLFVPSLGWHAYYGLLGTLGAWLAIAAWLSRRMAVAVAVVAALALLRAGRTGTPSKDWGSEWFQRRAADFGNYTRGYFLSRYPAIESHSRIFLSEVPGGVGLVPGGEESPAFRIWYGDTTLHTFYASRYRPRARGSNGRDYLFTYDSTSGWHEDSIVVLPEHPSPAEREAYAQFVWKLGDFAGAAAQYVQLVALVPSRWDYAFNLGSCMLRQGDSTSAALWYQRAATTPGVPAGIVRAAQKLHRSLPP